MPPEIKKGLLDGTLKRVPLDLPDTFTLPKEKYFISDDGKLFSLSFLKKRNKVEITELKGKISQGYRKYTFSGTEKKCNQFRISANRVVVIMFVGPIEPSQVVIHWYQVSTNG